MSIFNITDDHTWYVDALCRQFDPEPWHAEQGAGYEALKAEAKRICSACPAKDRCLTEHLTETYGIWGGLTPNERARLRRTARRAAA